MKKKIILYLLICTMLPQTAYAYGVWPQSAIQSGLLETDGEGIRIAVIDTGIFWGNLDKSHIEEGKNYLFPEKGTKDLVGHGTAIAGILLGSKELGLEGIVPKATLVPLVYYTNNDEGETVRGNVEVMAQAIYDAIDVYGCQVINISSGLTLEDDILLKAIDYAEEQGVVVVSAAGNDYKTEPGQMWYPAGYDTVIGVAAIGKNGQPSDFSQHSNAVDLSAPGSDIKVILAAEDSRVISGEGTSYATAFASGGAALLLAKNPNLTPAQVRQYLYETALDIEDIGFDTSSGWGVIQLDKALAQVRTKMLLDEGGKPSIEDGITLVPAKKIFEELGFYYQESENTIIGKNEEYTITFNVNERIVKKNDDYLMTKNPNKYINNQFYIPLSIFEELVHYKLSWNPEENFIMIDKNKPKHFVELDDTPYTIEEIEDDIYFGINHYKDITKLEVIGSSFEGKPLYVIKVGVPSENKKPSIFLMSNIHAREDFSSMLTMKMLDYILFNFYEDGKWGEYNVKNILENIDIYIMPIANPDGLSIAHNGIEYSDNAQYLKSIPNIGKDDRWWKANSRGVDLNSNFGDGNWDIRYNELSSSKVPASEGYKGAEADSEPETKAIESFCEEVNPLMVISYHTSGNIIYWADTHTHSKFDGIDNEIVNRMSDLTKYRKMPISINPKIFSCGFENWFKAKFYRIAMCVELSPAPDKKFVQHPDGEFESLVWDNAKYSGLQLAVEALNYKKCYYDVYQGDKFLKTFYLEEKAIVYAKQFADSKVIQNNNIIWDFNEDIH